jgi:hypothetical protein
VALRVLWHVCVYVRARGWGCGSLTATTHIILSSGLLFVAGFREFTSETHVSATNFVAMRPTLIAG